MAIDEDDRQVEGIWRCACHDAHFLTITFWKSSKSYPDLEVEGFLQIEGENRFYQLWRQRLKAIWQLLRGRAAYYGDVVLDDPKKAREAAYVLTAFANEFERWQNARK
jgi:hypothetical protein